MPPSTLSYSSKVVDMPDAGAAARVRAPEPVRRDSQPAAAPHGRAAGDAKLRGPKLLFAWTAALVLSWIGVAAIVYGVLSLVEAMAA